MKYHGKKKHSIALLLTAMMILPPVSAQAVTFADINQVPWPGAEVSINKAAELGLVVGETINGKSYFKPKDPVSLTQSCQLAYKVLLETGKAKADSSIVEKWSVVMNTYKIQSWAHPAVSFCLENGIIQIADLSNFIKGEVNVSATREQAAEILGHALEVGVSSLNASASSTSFKDNASISADARPYIALLNAQKIVNGDDKGNFNPKNTLNRTETAVMVTNLYNVLKNSVSTPTTTAPTSQSGKVAALTNFYVNFENSTAYYLYASTSIPVTLNGATSSISEVATLFKAPTAMSATLTLDGSSKITAMAVTADNLKTEEKAKDTEGVITNMTFDDDDNDGKLEINDNSTYYVEDVYGVTILITDEGEDEEEEYDWEELMELYKDCKDDKKAIDVKLTLSSSGNLKKIVGEVTDADSSSSKKDEAKGKIDNMTYDKDDDKGEIKIGGKTYKAADTDDVDIDVKDGATKISDWSKLYNAYRDGKVMELELVVDDKEVLEIAGRVTFAEGYLTGFGDEYLKLEGTKSGDSAKYYFTDYDRSKDDEEEDWEDDAKDIEIDGLSNVDTLYDFYDSWLDDDDTHLGTDEDNDDVFFMEFTLDKDGFITSIEAEQE